VGQAKFKPGLPVPTMHHHTAASSTRSTDAFAGLRFKGSSSRSIDADTIGDTTQVYCDPDAHVEAPLAVVRAWPAPRTRTPNSDRGAALAGGMDENTAHGPVGSRAGSLGRCPSTANLKCFYSTGFSVGPAQARDVGLHHEVSVATKERSHAARHRSELGHRPAGLVAQHGRQALVDITNTRTGNAAAVEDHKANKVAVSSMAAPKPVETNPQLVQEYCSEMMRNMLQCELRFMPKPDYMHDQPQINAKMRAILNDWLYEVHRKYCLRRETLFLAISTIDRYLSQAWVSRQQLQLVGVTALNIAAKFEEIESPELVELVYVTADSYTKQQIMDMEITMLTLLRFEIAAPTSASFLRHYQAALDVARTEPTRSGPHRSSELARSGATLPPLEENAHAQVRGDLAWYVLELSLLEEKMMRHPPSLVAASSLLLSNKICGQRPAWPAALVPLSGYVEKELEACAFELAQLLDASTHSSLQAIRQRYRHTEMFIPGSQTALPPH